jgi:A/G-specific adenine glycosylase
MPPFPSNALYQWYQKYQRILPWREDPTPYKVWISEIMLQQTQVDQVIPYFKKFIHRFPNIQVLAKASEESVLELWSGLGYYSRARHLLAAAKKIVQQHHGSFPKQIEEVLKLPGIGPYTAGAILSIAYHLPLPILDGNVRRVLSRFFLIPSQTLLWKKSKEIVTQAYTQKIPPSAFNQALMELGALICTPKKPFCSQCPLQNSCGAKAQNQQEAFPITPKKEKTIQKTFALLIAARSNGKNNSEYLIRRRSHQENWLKNLWEFPMISVAQHFSKQKKEQIFKTLSKKFSQEIGAQVKIQKPLGTLPHAITKYRLKIWAIHGTIASRHPRKFTWKTKEELKQMASSSILKKALALLDSSARTGSERGETN